MKLRFITRTIHAYIDYPVAIALISLPFLFNLGTTNEIAKWLSVATGIAALLLTLVTDHETGVMRLVPFWLHVAIDRFVGIVFIAAPFVFQFAGVDMITTWQTVQPS